MDREAEAFAVSPRGHPPPGRTRAEGEEMSVVAIRPWTSHEDIVLQRLAAAGKYAAAIAVEMNRSESAIRSRAKKLKIALATAQRGPKAKEK
jgi:DNA-binding NarL/FixJ family response regulator